MPVMGVSRGRAAHDTDANNAKVLTSSVFEDGRGFEYLIMVRRWRFSACILVVCRDSGVL